MMPVSILSGKKEVDVTEISYIHSIWLRRPDLNRRPSGYEGVSAKIPWTDCRKQHRMDGISAHWRAFQPVLSNWCVGVFPVVGQKVGQAAMQKTQGILAA